MKLLLFVAGLLLVSPVALAEAADAPDLCNALDGCDRRPGPVHCITDEGCEYVVCAPLVGLCLPGRL